MEEFELRGWQWRPLIVPQDLGILMSPVSRGAGEVGRKERSQISFIRNCLQYLKGRIQNLGWSGEGRGCLCECLLQEIQVERRVTTTGEEFETRSCFRDPKLTVSMDE